MGGATRRGSHCGGSLAGVNTSSVTSRARRGSRRAERLEVLPFRQRRPWTRAVRSGRHALIQAAREKGFLWRTEQTYREWAKRFVRFLAPRSVYLAEACHIGAFLSSLAVDHRASQSTQKQALNALVFFLQAGLKRPLGEIPFRRAEPGRKVPTVLTREEIDRLSQQLTDTTQLMAQLAFGRCRTCSGTRAWKRRRSIRM